jgi:hypothetical protein
MPPQMEMAAEKVAATEEVAAEALPAREYEYRKVRQPAVCCRTSVALSILPFRIQTLPIC